MGRFCKRVMNEKKEITDLLLIIEHRSLVESKKTIDDLLKLSKKGNLKQKCKLLGGTFGQSCYTI